MPDIHSKIIGPHADDEQDELLTSDVGDGTTNLVAENVASGIDEIHDKVLDHVTTIEPPSSVPIASTEKIASPDSPMPLSVLQNTPAYARPDAPYNRRNRILRTRRKGMLKLPKGLTDRLEKARAWVWSKMKLAGRGTATLSSSSVKVGTSVAEGVGLDSTVHPTRTGIVAGAATTGLARMVVPPFYRTLRPFLGLATQNPVANLAGPILAPVAAPALLAFQQGRHASAQGGNTEKEFQKISIDSANKNASLQTHKDEIATALSRLDTTISSATGSTYVVDRAAAGNVKAVVMTLLSSPSPIDEDAICIELEKELFFDKNDLKKDPNIQNIVSSVLDVHAKMNSCTAFTNSLSLSPWEKANAAIMVDLESRLSTNMANAVVNNVASAEEDVALLQSLRALDTSGDLLPAHVPSMQTPEQYAQYCFMRLMNILDRAATSGGTSPAIARTLQHFYPQSGDSASDVEIKMDRLCQIASEYALGLFDRHQQSRDKALNRSAITGGVVAAASTLAPAFLKAGVAGAVAAGPAGIGLAAGGTLLALGMIKLRRLWKNRGQQSPDIQIAPDGQLSIARSLHERDTNHRISIAQTDTPEKPKDATPASAIEKYMAAKLGQLASDTTIATFDDMALEVSAKARDHLKGKNCAEDPLKQYSLLLSNEPGFDATNTLSLYESEPVRDACNYLANTLWQKLQQNRAGSLGSIAKESAKDVLKKWATNVATSKAAWVGGVGSIACLSLGAPTVASLFLIPLGAGVAWATIKTIPGGMASGLTAGVELLKNSLSKKK